MKYFVKIVLVILMAYSSALVAAVPTWSVVPSDYQFTMSMTGVVKFYCAESINENDIVAAFVGDECRGVQALNTDVNGRKFAFLTVYSNTSSNEEISFKLYKADEDRVFDAVFQVDFENDGSYGTSELPYEFKSNYELKDLILDNTIVYDYDSAGTGISSIQAINEVDDTLSISSFLYDTELAVDNGYFSIDSDSIRLDSNTNYRDKKFYNIHLVGYTGDSCTYNKDFLFEVINTNQAPTGLVKTDTVIKENEEEGSLVLELIAIDSTVNDIHTFELTGELSDWPDHEFLMIEGNQLLSTIVFDYEDRDSIASQVTITDAVGNTYTDTLYISILDVIEVGSALPVSNLLTPNGDGFNDFFEIKNVDLYANYSLTIFNDNGNVLYEKSSNYDNTWDGKNRNGKQLPTSSYYYVFQDTENKENRFIGTINLYNENN